MKKFGYILVVFLLFTACEEEKDTSSRIDLMANRFWRLETHSVAPPLDTPQGLITNLLKDRDSCETDDLILFQLDGAVLKDQGKDFCYLSKPRTYLEGYWALTPDEKQIIRIEDGTIQYISITLLTESNFAGSYYLAGDSTHLYTITYRIHTF